MNELVGTLLAVLAVSAWLFFRRANELCALQLTREGAMIVRGRAPGRLVSDAADIARRAAATPVIVRVVSEGNVPRLLVPEGMPDAVVQQLRNAVGQHAVAHFRTGKRE